MKKRIISILLVAMMLVSFLPTTSFADDLYETLTCTPDEFANIVVGEHFTLSSGYIDGEGHVLTQALPFLPAMARL